MKLLLTILLFIATAFSSPPKVRLIHIGNMIEHAKEMRQVVIIGYSDSMMLYRPLKENRILRVNCTVRRSSEQFRLESIKKKVMLESDLAGKWPAKGDTVLIIIGHMPRVELFAKKVSDKYRFWDPNSIPFANSVFVFPEKSFFHPLPACLHVFVQKATGSCTDGCLVDASYVEKKMTK